MNTVYYEVITGGGGCDVGEGGRNPEPQACATLSTRVNSDKSFATHRPQLHCSKMAVIFRRAVLRIKQNHTYCSIV